MVEKIRVLEEEIASWKSFADALRGEERSVFLSLLDLCQRYSQAIESSGKPFLFEPLVMSALIVLKMKIDWLRSQLEQLKREEEELGRDGHSRRVDL